MPKSISIPITGNAAPLRKAINEATGLLDGMTKRINPKVLAVGAAFSAVAGSVVFFGKRFAEAAAEDEQSQRQLALALRNTTGANDATVASTEKLIGAMQLATGVADTELRGALAGLTRATGDLYDAQQLLGVALDVAAGTGKDLSSVQAALSKAATGNFGALTKLGVPLDENIIKTKNLGAATDALRQLYGGAAAENADTFGGKMQRLGVRVDELQEKVGAALLPALEKLVDIGIKIVDTYDAEGVAGVFDVFAKKIGSFGRNADGTVSDIGKITNAFGHLYNFVTRIINLMPGEKFPLVNTLDDIPPAILNAQNATGNYLNKLQELNERYGETRGQVERNIATLKVSTEETGKGEKAVDKLAEKFKNLKSALKDAQTAARDYVQQIATAITSSISLSSALDGQASADDRVAEAVKNRDDAQRRADERRTEIRGKEGLMEYWKALDEVTRAEDELTAARKARDESSYTSLFQKQITAAKEFAGNLKALIGQGLRGAGLEQVLSLGPVAGNQVAKDLLAGTGGFNVSSLMSQLAEAQTTAESVGLSMPEVAGILGAKAGRGQGNIYLTVQAGVGDPATIGATVVEYLQKYQARVGRLPLKVA